MKKRCLICKKEIDSSNNLNYALHYGRTISYHVNCLTQDRLNKKKQSKLKVKRALLDPLVRRAILKHDLEVIKRYNVYK